MKKSLLAVMAAVLCLVLLSCSTKTGGGEEAQGALPTEEAQMQQTLPEMETTPVEQTIEATEPWVPKEAPAVRNVIPEAEKRAAEEKILGKGTFLFSGKTDEGYYPSDISWLTEAKPEDAVALIWACDDVTHGGWGVLGLSVNGGQKEITAVSDEPDRERLMIYSVQELLDLAGVSSASKIQSVSLGAWNGGRIAGLYFLPGDVAAEINAYLTWVEETEQIIHTYDGDLSNENAIDSAKAVYMSLNPEISKEVSDL